MTWKHCCGFGGKEMLSILNLNFELQPELYLSVRYESDTAHGDANVSILSHSIT